MAFGTATKSRSTVVVNAQAVARASNAISLLTVVVGSVSTVVVPWPGAATVYAMVKKIAMTATKITMMLVQTDVPSPAAAMVLSMLHSSNATTETKMTPTTAETTVP